MHHELLSAGVDDSVRRSEDRRAPLRGPVVRGVKIEHSIADPWPEPLIDRPFPDYSRHLDVPSTPAPQLVSVVLPRVLLRCAPLPVMRMLPRPLLLRPIHGEKRRSRALPRPVWRSRVAAQTQTSGRTSGTSPLSRSVEGTLSCCAIEPPHLVVVVLGWWWSCMRSCTIGGRVPREVSGPARQIALRANSVASLPTGGPKRRNVPRGRGVK